MSFSPLPRLVAATVSRRGKWIVVAAWLLAAGASAPLAARLPALYDPSLTNQVPAWAPSQQAEALASREFPNSSLTAALIVLCDPQGLTPADRRVASRVDAWLTSGGPRQVQAVISVYRIPRAGSQLISADGTAMVIVAGLGGSPYGDGIKQAVATIRGHLKEATAGTGLQAYLTGPAGIAVDAGVVFESTDRNLLLATITLVLLLLILLYRSPVLPLIPLIGVTAVLVVVQGLLAIAAQRGVFPVGQMPASIATVLVFGAGTDYTLFIVSRYREELHTEADHHVAIARAMSAVAEAIASSGGTVLLGVLALLLAGLGLYSSLGRVLAIAMAVILCAGLTLIPALLALLGRAAFWPLVPRREGTGQAGKSGAWTWVGRQVVVRPRIFALSGIALLALLALGSVGSKTSFSLLGAFRTPTESGKGFDVLRARVAPGELDPTAVYFQLADAYSSLAAVDAATSAAAHVSGVATVRSLTRPDGRAPAVTIAELQATAQSLPRAVLLGQAPAPVAGLSQNQGLALGVLLAGRQYVSADGSTSQLSVVFSDDPYALPAINRISVLRDRIHTALTESGASTAVLVAGQTATMADQQALSERDTAVVAGVVLLVVGLVLGLLLRSLVAPLYLLGVLALNFLAVLGLASLVFQRILSGDGLNYAVPLYTFAFLISLGADYTIFLMSRLREEARSVALDEALRVAVGRTGGVISSAGLILAGTFAVLGTLPLTALLQLGVCVAAGVLLDTFVVRVLVVPGVVTILGRRNWWPSALAKS